MIAYFIAFTRGVAVGALLFGADSRDTRERLGAAAQLIPRPVRRWRRGCRSPTQNAAAASASDLEILRALTSGTRTLVRG